LKLAERTAIAIIITLIYAIFSASFATASKLLLSHIPFVEFIFFCYLTGLICTTILIFFQKEKMSLFVAGNQYKQILRGIFGSAQTILVIAALPKLSIVNALLLRNTAPLWLPLCTFLLIKTEKQHINCLAIIIGFIGIIVLVHPHIFSMNVGVLYALLAGISLALSSVLARKLNNQREPILRTLFFTFIVPTICLSPLLINCWNPITLDLLFLSVFSGVLLLVTIYLLLKAYKYASPVFLAPYTYFSFLLAGIYDYWIWEEKPSFNTIVGAALILLGCIYNISKNKAAIEP